MGDNAMATYCMVPPLIRESPFFFLFSCCRWELT